MTTSLLNHRLPKKTGAVSPGFLYLDGKIMAFASQATTFIKINQAD